MTFTHPVSKPKPTPIEEQRHAQRPTDSPQAATRIIALTVVADGEIDQAELELLDRLDVDTQLGLDRLALRKQLLHCIEIAESDAHVAQGKAMVLNAAVEHGRLHRFMLKTSGQPP